MDDMRGPIEGVGRLYQQLDDKIAEKGGMGNLFTMHSRIRDALDEISTGEIDTLLNEVHRAQESLKHLEEEILGIRVLKDVFTAGSRLASGNHRL